MNCGRFTFTATPCNTTHCDIQATHRNKLGQAKVLWQVEILVLLQSVAECCSVLQCAAVRKYRTTTGRRSVVGKHFQKSSRVAVRCSVLQCVAVCCSAVLCVAVHFLESEPTLTRAKHRNTLQHTTKAPCNTLQHSATHYITLYHSAVLCTALQHSTATLYNTETMRMRKSDSRNCIAYIQNTHILQHIEYHMF